MKPSISPRVAEALGDAILSDPRTGSALLSRNEFRTLMKESRGEVELRGRRWRLVRTRLSLGYVCLRLKEKVSWKLR